MDISPTTCRTLEQYYHVNSNTLDKQYKDVLSDYRTWSELEHADVFCMREFGPLAIAAEHFLVLLFKRIPIYVIIVVKRTGGRRNRLHTLLLKKPQTPWSSGFLQLSAHKNQRSIGCSACRTICVF
jgi:hypothetical protein